MTRDLGEDFDAHSGAEFETRDIDATMATMSATPSVTHVPVMPGGCGQEAVRRFYETWFIALLPGLAPTGRKVVLPHVVIVGFDNGKIAYEHIYWDQASLLDDGSSFFFSSSSLS